MRQLLKFMNYAAQLMALIDIGKNFKRWATKSNIKKQKERPKVKTQMTSPSKKPPTTQKRRTAKQLINNHPAVLQVIPTVSDG